MGSEMCIRDRVWLAAESTALSRNECLPKGFGVVFKLVIGDLLLKGGRSCAGVHTITPQHVPMTSATPNHDRPTQIHQRE